MSKSENYSLEVVKQVELLMLDEGKLFVRVEAANVGHFMRADDYSDEAKEAAMSYANGDESVLLLDLFKDGDVAIRNTIVNYERMNEASKTIAPVMVDVWNTSKSVTVESLTEDTAKRLPDTDIQDIELCAQYLFDRELNKPLDIKPVLAEEKQREIEQ